jgi:hypothetical protein
MRDCRAFLIIKQGKAVTHFERSSAMITIKQREAGNRKKAKNKFKTLNFILRER